MPLGYSSRVHPHRIIITNLLSIVSTTTTTTTYYYYYYYYDATAATDGDCLGVHLHRFVELLRIEIARGQLRLQRRGNGHVTNM